MGGGSMTIFKKIEYLKQHQDKTQRNFGMVGMGYIVNVLNEYEQELKLLKSKIAEARPYIDSLSKRDSPYSDTLIKWLESSKDIGVEK